MIPTIKPEWRTSTVVSLCMAMRAEDHYLSALPFLADALQDAGCDDQQLLERLMGISPDKRDDERLVALIMSDEGNEAVVGITELADELGDGSINDSFHDGDERVYTEEVVSMGYDELMSVADEFYRSRSTTTQYGSDWWRSVMYNRAQQFWEWYRIITGKAVPDTDTDANPFSCSC